MPFVPHTAEDLREMLAEIGVPDLEALFDEIPPSLRTAPPARSSAGLSEQAMLRWMAQRAAQDGAPLCFAGAGSYDHQIPAAVWDIAARGEFLTSYTPYQAEASQGTLQVLFEFQSMMSELTAMDVSNASVYDGASGLAEAICMAVRANGRAGQPATVLVAETLHPHYRQAAANLVANLGIRLETLPMREGRVDPARLPEGRPPTALVLQQPNFFGLLEPADFLADWAGGQDALMVALVNPVTLAVLKPPGQWGEQGADIACGDGQPLGAPMSSGGPSFGFLCTRKALVRQLPGRLVGRTEDLAGRPGYTLTLQAREQHIRRGKARSNICTNQGLLATVATIHMALLGAGGLAKTALASRRNALRLVQRLTRIPGVRQRFDKPFFHECVLDLPTSAEAILDALLEEGIHGGVPLQPYFPEMENALLVCATEKRIDDDIEQYGRALEKTLA